VIIGAALAFVQDDIKKVLAYSTISQLGYMVMALGVGAWTAADEASLRGRGLGMISELMDAVEITSGDAGTKIVMRRILKS